MQPFLENLIKSIVDKPEAVAVSQNIDEQGFVTLTVSVDQGDMGKVIGKSGRIIRAIRDLVRLIAVKQNRRVNVILSEE